MAEPIVAEQHLEKNALSLTAAIMSGSVQVAPAFNVMFTTGLIAGVVGSAVPLVFLLAGLGVAATGNSFTQFSRVWPSAGSFVTFISRAIGPRTGLVIAVTALVGYIIAFSGVYVFVANYILTQLLGNPHAPGLLQITTVLYAALVVIPVILGVRVGLRFAIALYVFEIVILALFVIAVLVKGGAHGLTLTPFTPGSRGLKSILLGFALAFFAYGGFEAPAPLAEETENPRRNVPIAVMSAIAISAFAYILSSYAVVEGFGNASKLAADPAPFVTVSKLFISFLAPIAVWLLLTSVTSSFLAANTETARVIFNSAREGLLARWMARIQPRYRTPWMAVIAFVVPSVVIGLVSTAFTDPVTASGFLGTYGILGVVLMYLVTNVALVVLWFRERAAGRVQHVLTWLLIPAFGAVVLALPFWGTFQPGQAAPYSYLPYLLIALVGVGVLYMLYVQATRPGLLASAGSLIMGETESAGDTQGVAGASGPTE